MKIYCKIVLFIFTLLQYTIIAAHGFAGDTIVGLQDDQKTVIIKEIATRFFSGQQSTVCTFKEKSHAWKSKPVCAVAYCQSELFFELSFTKNPAKLPETIQCSPLQLFYRMSDKRWIPAHELSEGDQLLCKNNQTTQLQSKKQVLSPISLYVIEVKKHHTFVVCRQKILTHNMLIPIATTIGMAIPFDLVFHAGAWGCIFGPVSFCCSIAVAGIVATVAYNCTKKKQTQCNLVCDDRGSYKIEPHRGCFTPCNNESIYSLNTLEDVLQDAIPEDSTKGRAKQYVKPGGYEDALKDFDSLKPDHVENIPGKKGKVGILPDGSTAIVRDESTDQRPTLEIQREDRKGKKIKIRYDHNKKTSKG